MYVYCMLAVPVRISKGLLEVELQTVVRFPVGAGN